MNATRRAPGDARCRPAPIIDAPSQARFADTAGPGGDSLLVAITGTDDSVVAPWRAEQMATQGGPCTAHRRDEDPGCISDAHIWGHGEGETAQKRPKAARGGAHVIVTSPHADPCADDCSSHKGHRKRDRRRPWQKCYSRVGFWSLTSGFDCPFSIACRSRNLRRCCRKPFRVLFKLGQT